MPSVRRSVTKSKWKTNGKTEGRAWRVPLQNLTSSSQEQRWRNIKTRTGHVTDVFFHLMSEWEKSSCDYQTYRYIFIIIIFRSVGRGHVRLKVSGEEGCWYIFNLLSEDEALLLRCFLHLKADFSSNPTWSEENNQSDEQNPSIQCDAVKLGALMEANDRYSPNIVWFL